MSEAKIVVLGAGPTGLGVGYRLAELGYRNFHVYERADHLGGLAASFTDAAGFTWDLGGHVMFSHYDYYDRVFEKLVGDAYQLNTRESWVRACGTTATSRVSHPLRINSACSPARTPLYFHCNGSMSRARRGDGMNPSSPPRPTIARASAPLSASGNTSSITRSTSSIVPTGSRVETLSPWSW